MTGRRQLRITVAVLAISMGAVLAAQKLQMKDLPAAVQKGVQDNLKGGTLKTLSKEKEGGKTRDFLLDAKGDLIEVEDELTADALPAAVKAAFEKQGKIVKAESVTKGTIVTYEATVEKNGKKSAVGPVDANGRKIKG